MITIKLNNQDTSINASDAQITALAIVKSKAESNLPTDAAYLEYIMGTLPVSDQTIDKATWLLDRYIADTTGTVIQQVIDTVTLSPDILEAAYSSSIQQLIDNTAIARGYKDSVTCASYVSSTVTSWVNEAKIFIAWRDSVWTYALGTLTEAKTSGIIPTITDFMSKVPVIVWP